MNYLLSVRFRSIGPQTPLPASLSFWAAAATSSNSTNFLAMRTFLLICNVYDNYDNTVIIIIIYHAAVDWNCLCGTKPFRLRKSLVTRSR